MTSESAFVDALRALAVDPAARGLMDDAAVLEIGGERLVLTHDMIVEGVHYRPDDPPGGVAWKLVAVNLSDLAAKGAVPLGALLGYSLGEAEWDGAFAAGLARACAAFGLALLGGDTVAMPRGAPRALGLTAIGRAPGPVPTRSGAQPGDHLWVTGTIGDAGAGLRALDEGRGDAPDLVERYRLPRPRLEAGLRLAPLVGAMMDVSDGLLIDAERMTAASMCGLAVEIDQLPLSPAFLAAHGAERAARIEAAVAGDDYELLFAAAPAQASALLALSEESGLPFTRIGVFEEGAGLILTDGGARIALPPRLGFEHRG